jgi:hypothetical protein
MPLPDILKKRRKSSTTAATPNKETSGQPKSPVKVPRLPLDGFEVINEDAKIINGHSSAHNFNNAKLVTHVSDILKGNLALDYFIQYLDSRQSGNLIKFWLDIESFRAASVEKSQTEENVNNFSHFRQYTLF